MIVKDHHGERWATLQEAARLARVRPQTISLWVHRGRVRGHRTGRNLWVNMTDVHHCEAEWRTQGRYTGTRRRGELDKPAK